MYIIWIKSPALAFSKEYAELVLELKSFPKKSALSLSAGSPLRGPGKLLAACEKKSEKSEKSEKCHFSSAHPPRALVATLPTENFPRTRTGELFTG